MSQSYHEPRHLVVVDQHHAEATAVDTSDVEAPPRRVRLSPGWVAETLFGIVIMAAVAMAAAVAVTGYGWPSWLLVLTGMAGMAAGEACCDIVAALVEVHRINRSRRRGGERP